jgi:hypothetical protein
MYRVFIGDGSDLDNPDWVIFDVKTHAWDVAKTALLERLDAFKDYDCEYCRENAAQEAARLREAKPGKFEAEVEGDDYMILVEPNRNQS